MKCVSSVNAQHNIVTTLTTMSGLSTHSELNVFDGITDYSIVDSKMFPKLTVKFNFHYFCLSQHFFGCVLLLSFHLASFDLTTCSDYKKC